MMNVKSFVKRAKEQKIKMVVFQSIPTRRLYTTGDDKDMPELVGQALGWAALELARLTGHDAKDVLQSLYVHSMGVAEKVIEEEKSKSKESTDSLRTLADQAGEDEEDDDMDVQEDSGKSFGNS